MLDDPTCWSRLGPKVRGSGSSSSSTRAAASTSTLVLYPEEDGAKFDMEYYLRKHLPLAMAQWGPYGLQSYEVTKFEALPGQKLPYSAVCVMKWDNAEGAGKAMQGPGAKIV